MLGGLLEVIGRGRRSDKIFLQVQHGLHVSIYCVNAVLEYKRIAALEFREFSSQQFIVVELSLIHI